MQQINQNLLTRESIIKTLEMHRDQIKQFKVKRLALFGSYARNEQKKRSDIDFIVTFHELNYRNYLYLKLFLHRLFRRTVDLVIESDLRPEFSYIKKEAIYAKRL